RIYTLSLHDALPISVRKRGDRKLMEWDHVITLSVKPDGRRVDLFVQTRQQLSPATVLGVFPRLRWVPPDGILLVCAPYFSPRVRSEEHTSELQSLAY